MKASRNRELTIDDLQLSTRASNFLRTAGIFTVQALSQKTAEDLLKLRTCGTGIVSEISFTLRRFGFKHRVAAEPDYATSLNEMKVETQAIEARIRKEFHNLTALRERFASKREAEMTRAREQTRMARNRTIIKLRGEGVSMSAISRCFGMGLNAVAKICAKEERKRQAGGSSTKA